MCFGIFFLLLNNSFSDRHCELRSIFSEDDFFVPPNLIIECLVAGPAQHSCHDFANQFLSRLHFSPRFLRRKFD